MLDIANNACNFGFFYASNKMQHEKKEQQSFQPNENTPTCVCIMGLRVVKEVRG